MKNYNPNRQKSTDVNGGNENSSEQELPPYQDAEKLEEAYRAEGGQVMATGKHFDGASNSTVRRWLIKHGIHNPEIEHNCLADVLEEADPDEVSSNSKGESGGDR